MRYFFLAWLCISFAGGAYAFDDDSIKARCDAEWGTDFSMVSYCREQEREAGAIFDSLMEAASEDAMLKTIMDRCVGEWDDHYTMVVYCHSQESAALETLSNPPGDVPTEVLDQIRQQCDSEWGNHYSMVAYCADQQISAWRSLQ